MVQPDICGFNAKTPVIPIPDPCGCNEWEKPVDILPAIEDADRNTMYILPDGGMWVLNFSGDELVQVNSNGSGGDTILYDSLGENEDGAMTQKAVREALFADVETEDIQIGSGAQSKSEGVAVGKDAAATSSSAVAIGNSSSATSTFTVAIGRGSNSTANGAVAIGSHPSAAGASIAIGSSAKASSTNTIAFGITSEASGSYSIAQGMKAKATASNAIAIGSNSESTFGAGVALGYMAVVNSNRSVALGYMSKTTRLDTVSVGDQSDDASFKLTRIIENVKDPELDQDAATKKYVDNLVAASGGKVYIANNADADNNSAFGVTIDDIYFSIEKHTNGYWLVYVTNKGTSNVIVSYYFVHPYSAAQQEGGNTANINLSPDQKSAHLETDLLGLGYGSTILARVLHTIAVVRNGKQALYEMTSILNKASGTVLSSYIQKLA